MKRFFSVGVLFILSMSSSSFLFAKEYKAAVIELGAITDVYVKLLTAIGEETNNTFKIQILPRPRAIGLFERDEVALVVPLVRFGGDKNPEAALFDAADVVYKVCYVLYTGKNSAVTVEGLKNGNKENWVVEIEEKYKDLLEFKARGTISLESGFKRVDAGTTDGILQGQPAGDGYVKKNGLKNIKRVPYDYYDVTIGIKKGTLGGELDQVLQAGLKKLKANGKFDAIAGGLIKAGSTFIDWQP